MQQTKYKGYVFKAGLGSGRIAVARLGQVRGQKDDGQGDTASTGAWGRRTISKIDSAR